MKLKILLLVLILIPVIFPGRGSAQEKLDALDLYRNGQYEEAIEVCLQELVEMPKNRKNATCCGTSSWVNCDAYSRMIQANRLKEAKSTGAEVLITACPKCQIHFSCTQNAEGYPEEDKIKIVDLTTLFAEAIP